jgi:type IX secretion system PorP/SprF family membrane protein
MNQPAFLKTDQMMTRLVPQITVVGGHTFKVNNEFDFKPSVLLRSAKLAPFLAEINAAVLYEDRIWAGLGYRYKSGFTALAQIQFEKHFTVGYSYEHTVSTLPQAGWSTHEITLGYELQMFRGQTVSPRYF